MQLGVMGVATPLAINLAAIGEAAAFDNTDYKALVCPLHVRRQRLRQHRDPVRQH
jgi:uncharacterized protein (DUF1501 family)